MTQGYSLLLIATNVCMLLLLVYYLTLYIYPILCVYIGNRNFLLSVTVVQQELMYYVTPLDVGSLLITDVSHSV